MAFSKPKAHERAERYAAKGQHDKAAREYQTIVEHDPKDIRAWLMWADCLVRCGDRPGAVERYERVATYYVEAKEDNKALAVYRQVLNLAPQRLDVQTKVAALNLRLGHTQDAIALYERIGHAQMQLGRMGEALATYEIVADIDPTAVARRLRLAELFSREKRTKEAVRAFEMAGDELHDAGRMADYVRVAERLLFHDESQVDVIRKLSRAYLELGDPRRALMKLNGLLRTNSRDEEGIELLAETFMSLGKPEKALSALEELARALKAKGPDAKADTIRILRRGLQWRPAHVEFREALTELEGRRRSGPQPTVPAAAAAAEESDEIDLDTIDEGDLVELDDDDLVIEEGSDARAADQVSAVTPSEPPTKVALPEAGSSAPGTRRTTEMEAVPSVESSLTQSVLSEVAGDSPDVESLTDFDKILFEARVYIKYRLFEHSLDHILTALGQQPMHIGALSLQARALTELQRGEEAADVHVKVAELVAPNDPKLAREHLSAATALVEGHAGAEALAAQVAPRDSVAVPVPVAEHDEHGDSGAFDLLTDSYAGQSATGMPVESSTSGPIPISVEDEPAEPAANLIDAHEHSDEDVEESTQPFTPVDPSLLEEEPVPAEPEPEPEPAQTGRTLTPYGNVPEEAPRTGRTLVQIPAMGDDGVEVPEGGETPSLDFGTGADDDLELDLPPDMAEAEAPAVAEEPAAAEAEPAVAQAPVAAEAPAGGWPDISDDLAEVRFYLDQGLDEDAEAALEDLDQRYPGHPEIRALRGGPAEEEEAPAVLLEAEAAEPLFDVDEPSAATPLLSFDEDEDEDDYLSSIFAEPSERENKPSAAATSDGGGAGANLAEGQSVDAATAFDLGVAYREMGLVDAAIAQFEGAAGDPQWRARALTMLGALRVHQGQTEVAIANLQEAVGLASTGPESSEAAYELAVLYEKLGDTSSAVQQLQSVTPGYRDRDQRLAALGG
ncbi:MAG: tetratricopeptide repeat protein [Myxococcota bacterium]